MAPDDNNHAKKAKRASGGWVMPNFGNLSSSSSSSTRRTSGPHKQLMSAPAFNLSPQSKTAGRAHQAAPPSRDRTDLFGPETPSKRIKTETTNIQQTRLPAHPSSDDGGPPQGLLDSPSTSTHTTSSSTRPLKPLTTPSRHLPPPPTYPLPRSSSHPTTTTKRLAPISAVLPAPIKTEPRPVERSPKREKPLVELTGVVGHVEVKDEIEESDLGEGGSEEPSGEGMGARELLSGKSPSKGKKRYTGVLPLSSNASLLLASQANLLKHFYTKPASLNTSPFRSRRHSSLPPPDLHLQVISLSPASVLRPRLLRMTCRILPPLDPGSPTKTDHDDSLDEDEAVGTVLLMLPEGDARAGRREVAVGRTVQGWRPWLEVDVGVGGEKVLMLDKFEVE